MSSVDSSERLPIGILLPTRNSMPWLERHVKGLKPWLHRAEQVVVVDSQSTDGTVDYLVKHLQHPALKILQHPPGLYESWNFGIQNIDSDWLYIATVGDRIAGPGIENLLTACLADHLDVAISAPVFITMSGEVVDKAWPIHRYIKCSGKSTGNHIMSPAEVFLWNTLFIPGSLMGSSASNLYRTTYMKSHPFRTELGHAGDIAWGVENAFAARWGLITDCYSEFMLHPPASRRPKTASLQIKEALFALSRQVFQQKAGPGMPLLAQYSDQLSGYWAAASKHSHIKNKYFEFAGRNKVGFFSSRLWRYRIQQSVYSRKKVSYRNKVIEKLYP